MQRNRPQRCIFPEPETWNGLSLARNDAFATIARSMLLACPSNPRRKVLQTRSIKGSSVRPVSRPKRAGSQPQPVVCDAFQRSHNAGRSPLPFGSFDPLDRSVQPVPIQEARLTDARLPFAPRSGPLSITPRINAQNPYSYRAAIISAILHGKRSFGLVAGPSSTFRTLNFK